MKQALLYFLFGILLSSCASLPKEFQTKDEVIAVGPGPEDMVIDTISEKPRLLISCNSRRKGTAHYGEVFVYNPDGNNSKTLKRLNEPKDLLFNPHGIDLVQVKDSLILLVVNHEHEQHINSILRYRVVKNEMIFLNKIVDPLISSPNAVTGFTDGTLLVSNDAKKAGNFWEPLLKLKRAQIVYWNGTTCSVASEKYCYTNGIIIKGNTVYLASSRQNKVWQFNFKDGKMLDRTVVAKVHGPDNIRFDGDDLLVPCHLKFIAFLKHFKDSANLSPTTTYKIDPKTHEAQVVYFDSGEQLSAGSTSVVYQNYIYTSGVFDGKIVRKKLK